MAGLNDAQVSAKIAAANKVIINTYDKELNNINSALGAAITSLGATLVIDHATATSTLTDGEYYVISGTGLYIKDSTANIGQTNEGRIDIQEFVSQFDIDQINKKLSISKSYNTIASSFISRSTGDPTTASGFTRTTPISIADLVSSDGVVTIDIGIYGGSIIPVAYYNSSTINSTTYISGEILTGSTVAYQTPITNYELTIPPTATHVVFSWNNTYGGTFAIRTVDNVSLLVDELDTKIANNSLAIDAINTKFITQQSVSITPGSFYSNSTGAVGSNGDYSRTDKLELSDLGEEVFIDISNYGGSIAPVAYFDENDNYLGYEIATVGGADPNAGTQFYNYKITPLEGATKVAFSWNSANYNFALYIVPDQIGAVKNGQTVFNSEISTVYQIDSVFGMESYFLGKRAAINSLGDFNPLLVIEGQSNADGREDISNAPQWLVNNNYVVDRYMMWDRVSNQFAPYEVGVNTGADDNDNTKFSFDIYFAKAYLDANPTETLYAIRKTLGGTPIFEGGTSWSARWQPKTELIPDGERALMTEFIDQWKDVVSYCDNNDLKVFPLCIISSQGESDADRAADGGLTAYTQNKKNVIASIRSVFKAPKLPYFDVGVVSTVNTNYNTLNGLKAAIEGDDDFFKFIDTDGNNSTIDGLHYDATALEYIGNTAYNLYLSFNPSY